MTCILAAVLPLAACSSHDRGLAEFASKASEQQARQNAHMAEQSQAVIRESRALATTAQELVKHDAAARREMIQAHDRLQQQQQTERASLDRQREVLAAERKASAQAAVRDPVI